MLILLEAACACVCAGVYVGGQLVNRGRDGAVNTR